MAGGAGGIGRPGANIAAGMPQGQAMAQQQGAQPMPTTQPAISPMQQYLQSLGITRSAFNPAASQGATMYAAPRPVPTFNPGIRANMPSAAASGSDPAKPSDYQQMRDELTQLRDWQARYTGNQNYGGGGGGN